ncbi:MAG: amidohydrolase [Bacillota bacterium]|nr:MAG: amidohydrolase [Bacillota bacterium]
MKAIIHTTLYDFHKYHDNAYILFDEKIIEIGSMSHFKDLGYEIINGKDHLVLPGLICGHTHVYSAFARGLSLPFHPNNFQDILNQLWWKLDSKLDLDMIYHSGIVFGLDFLKNGVTTIIDHHASGIDIKGSLKTLSKAISKDVGLRGIYAFETSDRFDVDKCIKENISFATSNHSDFSRGLFGLHASSSLSEKTLTKVKKQLGDLPIHIHVAESTLDEMDAINKYKKPIIHRLVDHGLLNPQSIIAHAIHISDEELDLIKEHQAVIAVNYTSNMNNGVGVPNIHRFIDKGIPVIIGNDGISQAMTSEYLMAYYAMHHFDQSPNPFQLQDLLKIIINTYDYASQILETKLGKLEKDYQADLLIVPYIPPTPMDAHNPFGHLFFGLFHSFKPKHVFIKGKQKIRNYQAKKSLEETYRNAQQSSKRLWDILSKDVS